MATTRAASNFAGVRGLSKAVEIGSRVFLRYPVPSDRDEFLALRRASRAFLEPWEPRPPRGFNSWGDHAFERELGLRRTASSERLMVCRMDADAQSPPGAIVGKVSISGIFRGPFQSCHIGYWIGADFAGCGRMTQAVGLTLRHIFVTLELHRVEANIQPHNQPSRGVAQRNGFRLEGFSPRYLQIAGRWADHERWAITSEEWRAGGTSADAPKLAASRPRGRHRMSRHD